MQVQILDKFEYKKQQGTKRQHAEIQCTAESTSSKGDPAKMARASEKALSLTGAVEGDVNHIVKMEFPKHVQLQCQLTALRTSKSALDKCHTQGLDTLAALEVKSVGDAALAPKVTELNKAMQGMHLFLGKLRMILATGSGTRPEKCTDDDVQKVKDAATDTSSHLEGFKLMHKRLKTFLQ